MIDNDSAAIASGKGRTAVLHDEVAAVFGHLGLRLVVLEDRTGLALSGYVKTTSPDWDPMSDMRIARVRDGQHRQTGLDLPATERALPSPVRALDRGDHEILDRARTVDHAEPLGVRPHQAAVRSGGRRRLRISSPRTWPGQVPTDDILTASWFPHSNHSGLRSMHQADSPRG